MSNNYHYSDYTVSFLRDECRKRHISNYSRLKKDELIHLLESDDRNIKIIYKDRQPRVKNNPKPICQCRIPGTKIYEFMCINCKLHTCQFCSGRGYLITWPSNQKTLCKKCRGNGKL
jgi:hypothetical protein